MAAKKSALPDDLDMVIDLDAARASPGAAAAPAFIGAAAPAKPAEPREVPVASKGLKSTAVNMSVYLMPADHRRLRMMAAAEGRSIQSLMLDGLDLLLANRSEAPVSRWQTRRRRYSRR